MTDMKPIQGELQAQIMAALWRSGAGTVEQIRAALPARYRSAYTTIQTVLNRLAGRGLLGREPEGNAIVYRPSMSEAEYLARSIDRVLASASTEAREAVLARLVGRLEGDELARLRRRPAQLRSARPAGRS